MNKVLIAACIVWGFGPCLLIAQSDSGSKTVTIAQISDTHLGEKRAPHAEKNLKQAVEMVNERQPDAVVLSGDIGENSGEWEKAKSILKKLKPPLFYAPGNHDVHSNDVERYREVFGRDFYAFRVKWVTFLVIDSQLLGNFDVYEAKEPMRLPSETEDESERMLSWLSERDWEKNRDAGEPLAEGKQVIIGVQHIPVFRDGSFPDPKPYWVINEPYRSQELKMLHDLGIKHMLVGHWHNGRVFKKDGITWHVAPATSWLPWGGELGFAVHTIGADGDVKTEFVPLPGAKP
jgi:3',5'-cyclic AMP phosphodiesterase CpdA